MLIRIKKKNKKNKVKKKKKNFGFQEFFETLKQFQI